MDPAAATGGAAGAVIGPAPETAGIPSIPAAGAVSPPPPPPPPLPISGSDSGLISGISGASKSLAAALAAWVAPCRALLPAERTCWGSEDSGCTRLPISPPTPPTSVDSSIGIICASIGSSRPAPSGDVRASSGRPVAGSIPALLTSTGRPSPSSVDGSVACSPEAPASGLSPAPGYGSVPWVESVK